MEFGTIKSIIKKPTSAVDNDPLAMDDMENTPNPFDSNDELDIGMDDAPPAADDKMSELLQRLSSVRAEIDSIFADMGYGEFDDGEFDDGEMEGGEFDDSEFDFGDGVEGQDGEFTDDPNSFDDGEFDDSEFDFGDENAPPTDDEFGFGDEGEGEFQDDVDGDPDFQGNIRTVAGANLVYKRKGEDGNYEELWVFNIGEDMKQESRLRRAILAGTDIVPNQRESEDGSQREETWSVGNVQYLKLTGIPN